MVEIVKQYGSERIMTNSAADWGISDPLAVPKTAALMKERGITDEDIRMVTYQNAITAFAQSGQLDEADFVTVKEVDQVVFTPLEDRRDSNRDRFLSAVEVAEPADAQKSLAVDPGRGGRVLLVRLFFESPDEHHHPEPIAFDLSLRLRRYGGSLIDFVGY